MNDKFFISADKEYYRLVEQLKKKAPELFERSLRSYEVEKFIRKYGESNERRLNYNDDYLAFNQAFFLKNLYKCFIVMSFIKRNINFKGYDFVDIGSGAGAFSLAAKNFFRGNKISLKLIDNCSKQLDFSKRMMKSNHVDTLNGFFPSDFQGIKGIRLASYWLCEQEDNCILDESGFIKNSIIDKAAIFIDYPNMIGKLISKLQPTFEFIRWSFNFKIPPQSKKFIHESNIRVHGVAIFKK